MEIDWERAIKVVRHRPLRSIDKDTPQIRNQHPKYYQSQIKGVFE